MKRNLRIEAIATELDCSVQTISAWYRWKKLHAEHELAQLLPTPTKVGRTNVWTEEDLQTLKDFQSKLTKGQHGIMGDIRYRRKEK